MVEKPEAEVKKAIKSLLDELNAWHFMPMQTMGKGGIPDHIACVPKTITPDMVGKTIGVFVGIEAKRLNKEPTPLQAQKIVEIRARSGIATYIHGTKKECGNFNAVAEKLRKLFDAD